MIQKIALLCFTTLLLLSCERDISVDLPDPETKIVVEGQIENGSVPIVLLNINYPFFGTFSFSQYQENFIHNALVQVSNGQDTMQLQEICYSTLTPEQKKIVANLIGIQISDSIAATFDFCVYTTFTPTFIGQLNTNYHLYIKTPNNQEVTAITSIPPLVPLDSIWSEPHNNPDFDSLKRVYALLKEPDTIGNAYRYFTKQNSNPSYPGLRSVYEDSFTNGTTFYFPLDRGQPRSEDLEPDTYGYFTLGDTIAIKWATIDKKTYDFWRTLEFGADSAGPFGTTTQVLSNINGGIGIWAGYGVNNYIFYIK